MEAISMAVAQSVETGATAVEGMGEAACESLDGMVDFSEGMELNEINPVELQEGIQDGIEISPDALENISERVDGEGVQEIRDKYENVDRVMGDISEKVKTAETPMDFELQRKRIEKYKGTIFEDMCKEELKDKFESVDMKQVVVETEEGNTKPDIVLRDAKEDIKIGNTEVNKGEDLYCEVKCGSKDYIESEMPHIEKQVMGHQEGKSVVVVTKDYLDIAFEKRLQFEQTLESRGSSVCVTDVYADEVEAALYENILGN